MPALRLLPVAAIGGCFVARPAGGDVVCVCPWVVKGLFLVGLEMDSSSGRSWRRWAWPGEEGGPCCCFPLADTAAGNRSMM